MIDWATIGKQSVHPTKRAILEYLDAAPDQTASPKEMAKALDIHLSSVSYYVKCLADDGYLGLVKTEPRRGALAHFYRLVGG